jgi:hypothetical protein
VTRDHRDPFAERVRGAHRQRFHALGSILEVEADNARLLALAAHSFGSLPRQRLGKHTPRYVMQLRAAAGAGNGSSGSRSELISGAGVLGQVLDGDNYALVSPHSGSALVSISQRMLERAYVARYDLIEFAAFTLATRCGDLVPLHAACIGRAGRGALVLGDSGAGKSTLCVRAAAAGFEFLAEDAVLVTRSGLRATGLPTFLHLRCDARAGFRDLRGSAAIVNAPVIQRRSGVRKFELDMRGGPYRISPHALSLEHVVVLRADRAKRAPALRKLGPAQLRRALTQTQPYAAGLPGWPAFLRRIASLPAYELYRGAHPDDSVAELQRLFERPRT